MKKFTADLHVHSVLSPCGDLEMSPLHIISVARKRGLDIIGITDHNSTKHCRVMQELGKENGICVLPGVEVNTKEEIHCLAFFENLDKAEQFQHFLDRSIPQLPNDPGRFGDQVVVDRHEQVLEMVELLLINAISAGIQEVVKRVHALGGLFIPAHINRPYNSLLSQLGFLPDDLHADALEINPTDEKEELIRKFPDISRYTLISNSDAHRLEQLGRQTTIFEMEAPEFHEVQLALRQAEGRNARIA